MSHVCPDRCDDKNLETVKSTSLAIIKIKFKNETNNKIHNSSLKCYYGKCYAIDEQFRLRLFSFKKIWVNNNSMSTHSL